MTSQRKNFATGQSINIFVKRRISVYIDGAKFVNFKGGFPIEIEIKLTRLFHIA